MKSYENVNGLLDEYMRLGVPGCDCVIYYQGSCIFRRYLGEAVTGKEWYRIYSCSKLITCVAALMLYEQGMIRLEDPLSMYLDEFKNMKVNTEKGIKKAKHPITIKNLFCMTAGFSYNLYSPELERCRKETNGRCSTREVMHYLAKEPLLFEPGERWEYGLCHDVLAAVVEVVSGMRFGTFVREKIFRILGMENSTFLLPEKEFDKLNRQYYLEEKSGKVLERDKNNDFQFGYDYESGGAGCVSTTEDYIKFLEGLRTGKLLRKDTLHLMTTNMLTEEKRGNFWLPEYGYGLGIRCPKKPDMKMDIGWTGAAGAYALIDLYRELSLFYVQHVRSFYTDELRNKLYPALLKDLGIE